MNTAKCEAMSFPQHGNLLSSISGRTPKEYHKDLAVCDLKKKEKKDGIVKEIGRHHDRHTRYIMLMMMVTILMTVLLMT